MMTVFHLHFRAPQWALVHEGSGRVVQRYGTRREAIMLSVTHVTRRRGVLVVHGRDGAVQEWRRCHETEVGGS
jgi:predicted NAD/FAD-binding protein